MKEGMREEGKREKEGGKVEKEKEIKIKADTSGVSLSLTANAFKQTHCLFLLHRQFSFGKLLTGLMSHFVFVVGPTLM